MEGPAVYTRYRHQRERWRINERLSEYVKGHRVPIAVLLRLMELRDKIIEPMEG